MRPQAKTATMAAALSGAAALGYETTFLRRLSVVVGGSATASALTLAVFMAGLGIGGFLGGRWTLRHPGRVYAALELLAAGTALLFPVLLAVLPASAVALLPLPTAVLLGATWPVLVRALTSEEAVTVYAANTFGALGGVLLATFWSMPTLGVRGAEWVSVGLGTGAALLALSADGWTTEAPEPLGPPPGMRALLAAFGVGFVALALEVVWMRLASVGLGATVQTIGLVLAVFLGMMAVGSTLGRRVPADPRLGAAVSISGLGVLAVVGMGVWPLVPYGVGVAFRVLGPEGLWLGHVLLAVLWMGGAPLASGLAFACLLRWASTRTSVHGAASWLYAVNTAGSTLGAAIGGLVLLPALEPRGAVLVCTALVGGLGVLVWPRRSTVLASIGLLAAPLLVPAWDARLYAVGVHLAVSDFPVADAEAISAYAGGEWELLSYDHGPTGAVAVGRSTKTGNVWLSINGKFDASTGADMPTQILSGELPVALAADPRRVAVVGLASGVTAGAVLREPAVERLDVFELEPAVVEASHFFDHVNGRPLEDVRTRLVVDDARAVFGREQRMYDVIISEPSNPWITGVSSLFTEEYWRTAKARLADDGVFCQWVQLYGLGPEAFRGLVRTFRGVFGEVWLYETIEGSDVLLIAGPRPGPGTSLQPTLDPAGVRRLGGVGWVNTDDHPRIEWEAPRWLHYATADDNRALIAEAAGE